MAFVKLWGDPVFKGEELLVPIALPKAAPTWPNILHMKTRPIVIERELLLGVGDRYSQALVEESMRNLRSLAVFALVRILAVRTERPDEVGLFVYTRDLWSLRTEVGFEGVGDAFQLTLQLTERNLFGLDKQASARFDIDPKAFSLGEAYYDPRLFGGRLSLWESFDVIFNRDSGRAEGSQGALSLGRPLYNLAQRWGYGVSLRYAVYVARILRGAEVQSFRLTNDGPEACEEAAPECVRGVWRDRNVAASSSLTYRHGGNYKQSVSLGLGAAAREVEPNAETMLAPELREDFERQLLPRARRQVYPSISYNLFLPRFKNFRDLDTFGQTETLTLGPSAGMAMAFPLRAFGSSSDSMTVSYSLGYTLAAGSAMAAANANAGSRLEDGEVVDQGLSFGLRGATPRWPVGRLVLKASHAARRRDTSNSVASLGGDSGLRGYPSGHFQVVGGSRTVLNLEYRTLPWRLSTVHLGGVVFFDSGSVHRRLSEFRLHHGAGLGLRLLFPQFNRGVFRLDLAVPFDRDQHSNAGEFFLGIPAFTVVLGYGSSQAVSVSNAADGGAGGLRPR
ncbi:MAG: BamA/TamA family outer membrane protein [Myxococcales bacterium]|nr:BamA/TamA family outer membrane protein [Myxococcales bacterium]